MGRWSDVTMEIISQYTNVSFCSMPHLMSNDKLYNLKTRHNNQILL